MMVTIKATAKMMDFGWRLNGDEDGHQYFTTQPIREQNMMCIIIHSNGRSVSLPIVLGRRPKGLGCSLIITHGTGYYKVEQTNGSLTGTIEMVDAGQVSQLFGQATKKREEFVEMAKRILVSRFGQKTRQGVTLTWEHNNRTTLGQYGELV